MLGIAVLQWNASHHTISLLEDLRKTPCLIAVCDNGSTQAHTDALVDYITSNSSEAIGSDLKGKINIIFIKNKCNSGFAAGMNLCATALLELQVNWVWLLNNDTRVDADSLSNILQLKRELPPGLYGTQMLDTASGNISFGNRFNLKTTRFKPIRYFAENYDQLGDWYPDGASLLIHKDVLEKVGFLSEDYFIYYEELDYKRRITHTQFPLKILPTVVVKHKQAGSSSQDSFSAHRMYHETYSTLTFYKKHHIRYFPVILLIRSPIRIISLVLQKRFREVMPVISATFDFLSARKMKFSKPLVVSKRYFSFGEK